MRAKDPSCSTIEKIPVLTRKRCPLRLRLWTNCEIRQQEIYRSIYNYLEPPEQDTEQLFFLRLVLESFGKKLRRSISSKQDLKSYKRFNIENYIYDIIAVLCEKPVARDKFHLSDGISFNNHINVLNLP